MIIWLASYPKSGNTWVRALLTNYLSKNKTNIFNDIEKIKKFPEKGLFNGIVTEEILKKDNLELFKYFIEAQEKINQNNKLNILKTHNFAGSIRNNPFTDSKNTCGLIYLIRDPRSVAVSYARHANITFEKSVKFLLSKKRISMNEDFYPEARLSWNIHAESWINSNFPKILIKYEDLHKDTLKNFRLILLFIQKFIKIEIDDKKINETIDNCSFENLSKLEKEYGFKERKGKENFFRKGEIDEWKNLLPINLIKEIENNFEKEMKELNYL